MNWLLLHTSISHRLGTGLAFLCDTMCVHKDTWLAGHHNVTTKLT